MKTILILYDGSMADQDRAGEALGVDVTVPPEVQGFHKIVHSSQPAQ